MTKDGHDKMMKIGQGSKKNWVSVFIRRMAYISMYDSVKLSCLRFPCDVWATRFYDH